MIPVVLLGAAGRMGRALQEAVGQHPALAIKACVDRAENPGKGAGVWRETLAGAVDAGDVVIEFSKVKATTSAHGSGSATNASTS